MSCIWGPGGEQVRTILNELFLGENRYKPFKDKTMSCFWGKRGSNQNDEPYLGENVSPCKIINELEFVGLVLLSNLQIFPCAKSNDQVNLKGNLGKTPSVKLRKQLLRGLQCQYIFFLLSSFQNRPIEVILGQAPWLLADLIDWGLFVRNIEQEAQPHLTYLTLQCCIFLGGFGSLKVPKFN